jgi:GH15 family glucan-1,4-alpha-glucosidase
VAQSINSQPEEYTRPRYPPIGDHGLIGDLQTAALVSRDGTIDWFCSPRFDSPSVFAAILDADKGGHFSVRASDKSAVIKQLYLVDTGVLITRYLTDKGVGEVVDFMPIKKPKKATDAHTIVRMCRVVRGKVEFEVECAPSFDYGREPHTLTLADHHALFHSKYMDISLHTTAMLDHSEGKLLENGRARTRFTLRAGESSGLILQTGPVGSTAGALPTKKVGKLFKKTVQFWREWMCQSTYRGRWRETVNRSALTLKMLTYAPTGAIVAAPTTALPEEIGGERNWDYRFTWVRDGSFSVHALMELGYTDEAVAFLTWLAKRVVEHTGGKSGPLKIMYRIDGSSDLVEFDLEHFEGYEQSKPVNVGNGAADQLQLDIYGEAVDAIYLLGKSGRHIGYDVWMELAKIIEWLSIHWDSPDEGIWETRGGQKDFVYSRLMCWVAFDRAIRISRERGFPAPIGRWSETRDAIYHQIMDRGYNKEVGAFVQHYGSDVLDASILKMALVGFVAPRDPRWLSTLKAVDEEIVSDSLVFRYNPEETPDGLAGGEGTFSLCTFWYVNALAQAGQTGTARAVFEQMLTYANHLGLYSEEIGPTGEQLGNFPQAFTHLALISAAVTLDARLDENPAPIDELLQHISDFGPK